MLNVFLDLFSVKEMCQSAAGVAEEPAVHVAHLRDLSDHEHCHHDRHCDQHDDLNTVC